MQKVEQFFGEFSNDVLAESEYLSIHLTPNLLPDQKRWKASSLSADFLANYLTHFLPDDDINSDSSIKEEVKNAVSYIANELLENAIKYSDDTLQYPVKIALQIRGNHLVFWANNAVNSKNIGKFRKYIEELMQSDAYELYMRKLEENAESDNRGSGIGYLTIINDY
ncbi:MAG: ATP-binding protein [Scytonema sp. CRU_2_7]|nr:ATP-binding protein [Scytonema sp. CRU_2_7]